MNKSIERNRIYHPYNRWEDFKAGFYDNCTGEAKKEKIQKVLEMFNSAKLTRKFMELVIKEWVYSCEHNLSNNSMNKIAYLGQAACCLYGNIPCTVTMECWRLLSKEVRDRSDSIASEVIKQWETKNIQLCLNID